MKQNQNNIGCTPSKDEEVLTSNVQGHKLCSHLLCGL